MPKKLAMTNQVVIDRLVQSGQIKYSNFLKQENKFCTAFDSWNVYDFKTRSSRTKYQHNYMIPIDIYKKHVFKRFKPMFNIGETVRVNQKSKRLYTRDAKRQSVGASQSFSHLGIGSGKIYHTEKISDLVNSYRRFSKEKYRITIGNTQYPVNLINASDEAARYNNKGFKKSIYTWQSGMKYTEEDFLKYIKIDGSGVFGLKKIINGAITNVFVHFMYPKWVTKREARYEITFDSGARGIWTNDYITRVYDTDIEVDEALMEGCCMWEKCESSAVCNHKHVHIQVEDCCMKCRTEKACIPIYDYKDLFDTTHGLALDLKDDK